MNNQLPKTHDPVLAKVSYEGCESNVEFELLYYHNGWKYWNDSTYSNEPLFEDGVVLDWRSCEDLFNVKSVEKDNEIFS